LSLEEKISTTIVQPAIFETFGLTVVEAMTCGLPTFATCKGGPAEIIVDGVSGFHIDPYHKESASERIADFLRGARQTPVTGTRSLMVVYSVFMR